MSEINKRTFVLASALALTIFLLVKMIDLFPVTIIIVYAILIVLVCLALAHSIFQSK